jgi:hypothetical protein
MHCIFRCQLVSFAPARMQKARRKSMVDLPPQALNVDFNQV